MARRGKTFRLNGESNLLYAGGLLLEPVRNRIKIEKPVKARRRPKIHIPKVDYLGDTIVVDGKVFSPSVYVHKPVEKKAKNPHFEFVAFTHPTATEITTAEKFNVIRASCEARRKPTLRDKRGTDLYKDIRNSGRSCRIAGIRAKIAHLHEFEIEHVA